MASPTVSIITPTYNRADLIGETVESILAQRFGDFELIIVDDGSTDDTADVLSRYKDDRIRIFRQDNRGEVAAINAGWPAARGRYAAVVSSDDPMHPYWLAELVAALESNREAVVAYPDWAIINEYGETIQVIRTPDYSRTEMIRSFRAAPGAGVLFRKDVADSLKPLRRPQFRYCADMDMWLRLCLKGPFIRVPKVLANWRSHAGSLTVVERSRRRAQELVDLAEDFFATPGLPADLVPLRIEALASANAIAAGVLGDADAREAARYHRRSDELLRLARA